MMPFSKTLINFAQPVIDNETVQTVAAVLRSNWLTSGPQVAAFERALSASFAGRPARAVTSATAALELALAVCDIGEGDEVITSAQSFFSTMNVIVRAGAKPVFVDCDLTNRAIDLAQVEAAISPRTRAIMPTHFPGHLVDMDALLKLAQDRGLRVIEDAALVHGSRWKDRPIGSFGDVTTFSFHPNKNMTTIEGGAIVVNTEMEAQRIETLRFHGIVRLPDGTRDVPVAGGKYNMSDVSAAIGIGQLATLEEFLIRRTALVERYFEQFPPLPGIVLPPSVHQMACQSWNMFCVLFPFSDQGIDRKTFRKKLQGKGIATGISYEALHLTTLGRSLGYEPGAFPNAERIARDTVTLPLHAAMTSEDVDRVCSAIAEVWQA